MNETSDRKRKGSGSWPLILGTLLIPTVAVAAHLVGDLGSNETPRHVRKPVDDEAAAAHRIPSESEQRPRVPKRIEEPESTASLQPEQPVVANEVPEVDEPPAVRRSQAQVEADLEAAFAEAGPRTAPDESNQDSLRQRFDPREIDALECRGSRCRMELSFADSETAEKRLQEALLDPQSELRLGGTVTSRWNERDGTTKVRVHLYGEEQDAPPEVGNGSNEE